ncbi:MAG TPA: DUF1848 domain-containing protein [Candidatus Lachnoclostridium stercoripullorum]|uniref:DUF1848 domain-containing protein n=1 Tax=Candidatus Lachnoclostridium stercoripullorum TaxID=2838635 RepID=A0A9D1W6C2_9FIRM|nr:DUF1848 domain-containing protein [Candidatus Lachnoclostridium stercoripullorum]
MIISASRRTDISTYYSEWFFNRLREGYVLVRNPMNARQISRISLSPEAVDGIVFWTKNPVPMLSRLGELEPYPYYFQFTLTAYGRDVEPNLPGKNGVLIPAFQELSRMAGRERVVWRYAPIFLSDRYTVDYHCRYFRVLAAKLGEYTEKCTVSFLDFYRSTARNMRSLHIREMTAAQQREMMERFSEIAGEYGLYIDTCSEAISLEDLGVSHASCVDRERLERIGGYRLNVGRDRNQRKECGCAASVDIGAYDTCGNGCLYCYATDSPPRAAERVRAHRPDSPILFGTVGPEDVIREREAVSLREQQLSLFDLP